jgi:hypothetical protein
MLPELGPVSATAHGFVWACEWWVFGKIAFVRRCHSSCVQKRCSSLQMQLERRQCFVVSLSERVEVVILSSKSVSAGCSALSCCTVGVLEMVFRLHTHVVLWNAKTSGVVRNVCIIVDGTER